MPIKPDLLTLRTYPKTLWLIAVGLIIHGVFGGLLTLSVDEAHYALYAYWLDWSYFDHPPLVGWIQWPLVLSHRPDWVLRLLPEFLWLLATLLAWQLAETLRNLIPNWAQTLQPGQAGHWAVLLILLAPVFHVLAVGLLPDTLLMVLILALMQTTLKLSTQPSVKWLDWVWLGVLLGLCGLSKYTSVLYAVSVIVFLCLNLGWRWLLQPGPWLAGFIALVLVSPVVFWNATHDWISFQYQIAHSQGGQWRAYRIGAFIGLQIVAFGPLVIVALTRLFMALRTQRSKVLFGLASFPLLPLLVTAVMAGGGRTLPHWMAPAWIAIIALAAPTLAITWQQGKRRLLAGFAWFQAILCTLAFVGLFFIGVPGLSAQHPLHQKNPLADLWGWEQAGQMAREIAEQNNLDTLSVRNWTLASRLAWYARPLPVIVLDDRFDQFDLWYGDFSAGQDTLFVNWSQASYPAPVGDQLFETCELTASFESMRFSRVVSNFEFLVCRNWQGQP